MLIELVDFKKYNSHNLPWPVNTLSTNRPSLVVPWGNIHPEWGNSSEIDQKLGEHICQKSGKDF